MSLSFRSLPAQMILGFTALVLLTATAIGGPAIWLIRSQLDRQAWAQLEQGSRAAQALVTARQNEVTNLATLTAQRPTLYELLAQAEAEPLAAYLATLQSGANLDLILICDDSTGQVVAQAGELIAGAPCGVARRDGFHLFPTGDGGQQVWLLAWHPVEQAGFDWPGQIVTGLRLDDAFARQLQAQTGVDQTFYAAGRLVATSLEATTLPHPNTPPTMITAPVQTQFSLNNHLYYAMSFPLATAPSENGAALTAEVALAVENIAATQRNLGWTMAASIVGVAVVGFVLGTVLARRISRPLANLAGAAANLSRGDLNSPIRGGDQVHEVALVAQALEDARLDLSRTMTRLRQERAWVNHLLESIVEGIVTVDHRGQITFFSQGAEQITGWPRQEVLGRPCDEVFALVENDQPFSRSLPASGQKHKIGVKVAGGRPVTLAITATQLLPPELNDISLVLVFRDVSEEEAVHRLMGHFLANVSHEFRTPLSALAASIELLLDQAPDLTLDELHELLTALHLGILSLQTLVDNLLESASIEAGRFKVYPRPANLSQIIAEAVRMIQPLLDKRGQQLVLDLPLNNLIVRADRRRTAQVLVNLLSNANKYGPDDAEIRVSAELQAGQVRVAVADRGPGVPLHHRQDLFHRFIYPRSDNDKAQYGVGLGLSVVKAVVEAQGGQVGVDDRPGGGLIFWFTLVRETHEDFSG